MTVSSTTTKASLSGDGTQHSFAYGFKIFADADLEVYIRDSSGNETLKTINTHYIVTGAGNEAGGNVLFKYNTGDSSDAHYSATDNRPASGETVIIKRVLTLTQGTDYVANDPFPAESHEEALDRLTFISQQMQEELDRSIKASVGNTITGAEFTLSASDRANKVFAFDSSGNLNIAQELGIFRGTDATTTTSAYNARDLVKSTTAAQLNNVYIALQDSPSGTALTNTTYWALVVDAVSAATSATNAQASEDEAEEWATKTNGIVDSTDYSSKAWAIGGTGVTDTASRGAAKEWATDTSGTVDTSEYSAKEYAQGTQSGTGGSAKAWAQTAEDTVVSGGEYSAKHYSEKASASATAAAADAVSTAADAVSTAADVVSTNADVVSAAASQVAAANSAAALAAALDGFDDKYLGEMQDTDTQSTASTTGTWVVGGSTITVTSATGIEIGQNVAASGIPNQANVVAIDGLSISISHVATVAGSGAAVVFTGYGVYGNFDTSIDGPSTDNDNNSLDTGALYYNSTDNEMRVYDGANWIAASASGSASMNIFEFTVSGSAATTFGSGSYATDDNGASMSYTADNLQVVKDGVLLHSDDYTATDGTTIVLGASAAVGSEIVVYAFKSFTVADTVSKSSGGTFNSSVTVSGTLNATTDVQVNGASVATTGKAIAMAMVFGG
jgi:hypothetical protein